MRPVPDAKTTEAAVARFRSFYETFSAAWLPRLEEIYASGFFLEDPFHTFHGDFDELRAYFARVLKLPASSFIVEDTATGADGSYVRWRWEWKLRKGGALRVVPGVTHLRFTDDGKVFFHRDLFDAAAGFFEALPGIGTALRLIKKRV